MTAAEVVARLERWRGWLKMAYNWSSRDEECYHEAVVRLSKEISP
jgi:hypothetical protein